MALICCLNKELARDILAGTQANATSDRHLLIKIHAGTNIVAKKNSYEERVILQHFPRL